jgi:hypothetical protein
MVRAGLHQGHDKRDWHDPGAGTGWRKYVTDWDKMSRVLRDLRRELLRQADPQELEKLRREVEQDL